MKNHKRTNYKKLFKKISKRIIGIFSKKKKIRHHIKKQNKYISFVKKLFKKEKKLLNKNRNLKNAKVFISSFVFFFLIITIISFLGKKAEPIIDNTNQNINYDFIHGSASGRDFLFEGETGHDSNLTITEDQYNSGQTIYVGTMNISTGTNRTGGEVEVTGNNLTGTKINTGYTLDTGENVKDPNIIMLPNDVAKYIIKKLKEQIKQQQLLSQTVKKDCISPRNTSIKNGDFVLAYQQRNDVNNICNVEKRYCNDGILEGTFSQEECNENAKYEYQTEEIQSYTQKTTDPYIQPNTPINNSADFTTDGKIKDTNISNTNRGYSQSGAEITTEKETGLKYIIDDFDCKSPRGDIVKNGQFVAAYKAPVGFIDLKCKSEYRYCTDGKLGGSYSYKECKYKDITYNDYLVGNTDTDKATTLDLMESIDPEDETDSENIRSKIQSLFK